MTLKLPVHPRDFDELVALVDGDELRIVRLLISHDYDVAKVRRLLEPPRTIKITSMGKETER